MDFKKLLWQAFIETIANDWEGKYKKFGKSWQYVQNNKMNFSERVSDDIEKRTKAKISSHTLNRYFNSRGFTGDVKRKTLDPISQYVGYKDFDDFKQKIEIEEIKKEPLNEKNSEISITDTLIEVIKKETSEILIVDSDIEPTTDTQEESKITQPSQTKEIHKETSDIIKQIEKRKFLYALIPFIIFIFLLWNATYITFKQAFWVLVAIFCFWAIGYLTIVQVNQSYEEE